MRTATTLQNCLFSYFLNVLFEFDSQNHSLLINTDRTRSCLEVSSKSTILGSIHYASFTCQIGTAELLDWLASQLIYVNFMILFFVFGVYL